MIYLDLFLTFLRMGLFNFGGGYAMITLMKQEVLSHGWLGAGEFADMIAVSQMTPGPLAVNLATYAGFKVAGFGGAALATLGIFLPSLVICVVVARLLVQFRHNRLVKDALGGIKPGVVALITLAFLFMTGTSLFNIPLPLDSLVRGDLSPWQGLEVHLPSVLVGAGVVVLAGKWKVDPLILVLVSGIIGFFLF